ncbi:MAG: hypothetical protein BWY83_01084 [bacterium ADurb.Bin478]|nr:MAG: hypothetical protein BWY83_01084 [bacterium ADurb.Bin478]
MHDEEKLRPQQIEFVAERVIDLDGVKERRFAGMLLFTGYLIQPFGRFLAQIRGRDFHLQQSPMALVQRAVLTDDGLLQGIVDAKDQVRLLQTAAEMVADGKPVIGSAERGGPFELQIQPQLVLDPAVFGAVADDVLEDDVERLSAEDVVRQGDDRIGIQFVERQPSAFIAADQADLVAAERGAADVIQQQRLLRFEFVNHIAVKPLGQHHAAGAGGDIREKIHARGQIGVKARQARTGGRLGLLGQMRQHMGADVVRHVARHDGGHCGSAAGVAGGFDAGQQFAFFQQRIQHLRPLADAVLYIGSVCAQIHVLQRGKAHGQHFVAVERSRCGRIRILVGLTRQNIFDGKVQGLIAQPPQFRG